MHGGFGFKIGCNYPEAYSYGDAIFEHNVCYQTVKGNGKEMSYIDYYGPANVTLRNNTIGMYMTKLEQWFILGYIIGTADCNPDDGREQHYIAEDNIFTGIDGVDKTDPNLIYLYTVVNGETFRYFKYWSIRNKY